MIDYQTYIGRRVMNKEGQIGEVISFDGKYIVVKYDNDEKKYNPDITFKMGFLSFNDDSLDQAVIQEAIIHELKTKKELEKQQNDHDEIVEKRRKVTEEYKRLDLRNRYMKSIFGNDFKYPPYEEFMKKNKFFINHEQTLFEKLFPVRYSYFMYM